MLGAIKADPGITTEPRGLTKAQSRQADLFSTAAVPERSAALDVCGIHSAAAAPKRSSLDTTNRSVLAFSNSWDHSGAASQELPWEITREVEGKRGQDRRSQEAEDFEK